MVQLIQEKIDPRLLETCFANFPNAEMAVLELTDNAIGDRILGEKMVLTVRVKPNLIKVLDYGGHGMGIDDLRNFLNWGHKSETSDVFRFYGQGGKGAIGYYGKRFMITTFPKGGDRSYRITEEDDFTKRLDGKLKEYEVKEDKTLLFDTGRVEIEIRSLTRNPNIKKLRRLLESTYGKLLQSGELQIFLNDKEILPEVLSYEKYSDFEEETLLGKVYGRLGIRKEGSEGGIRCYSQKRLIPFSNKESFGLDVSRYDLNKLQGEVNLDFVPVMPNKTSYDRGSKEWKIAAAIVVKKVTPFLDEIKNMGEVPLNLRKMSREIEDFVNSMMREGDADNYAKGRNPIEKQPEQAEKSIELLPGEFLKRKNPEPRTPPADKPRGSTQRLLDLGFELKVLDKEIRCLIKNIDGKKKAYVNIEYPAAVVYMSRRASIKIYCLESVALEFYKDSGISGYELVEKVNKILANDKIKMTS